VPLQPIDMRRLRPHFQDTADSLHPTLEPRTDRTLLNFALAVFIGALVVLALGFVAGRAWGTP